MKLYERVPPPEEPIPILVDPFPIDDDAPEGLELREVVRGMRNVRAGGASGICVEHIQVWLKGVVEEEEMRKGNMGHQWRVFVKLIQTIWERGEVP